MFLKEISVFWEFLDGLVGWGHGGSIRPEVGNWDLGGSWWGDDKNPS